MNYFYKSNPIILCYNVNMPVNAKIKRFDKRLKLKIEDFWLKYEQKIVLLIGFILVATVAFELGVLSGKKWEQKPLIIEKTAQNNAINQSKSEKTPPEAPKLASDEQNGSQNTNTPDQNCSFVGSKNSNKYHLPTCRWAKQIKPENLVCFKSIEDALSKGYQPDKNCVKNSQ